MTIFYRGADENPGRRFKDTHTPQETLRGDGSVATDATRCGRREADRRSRSKAVLLRTSPARFFA